MGYSYGSGFPWTAPCLVSVVRHRDNPLRILCIESPERRSTSSGLVQVNNNYILKRVLNFEPNEYVVSLHTHYYCYRYTTFIILYPIGVTGELLCFYWAQSYVRETKLWSIEMPNSWNFTFSYFYFLWIVMIGYIPIFPHLYLHMFAQRKKILGGGNKKKQ